MITRLYHGDHLIMYINVKPLCRTLETNTRLYVNYTSIKKKNRASLVAQWLRICLPMQGTRVRALVWEDPTCRGAARPVSHGC